MMNDEVMQFIFPFYHFFLEVALGRKNLMDMEMEGKVTKEEGIRNKGRERKGERIKGKRRENTE